ncbi:hypothetical protein MRS44_012672 [Fusarium solani]|uniref:uncharacterized protein n=1 Tax=Fusarium solani TaxID=169388 RepID=UPI0032C468EB|nr:hypothetical protein MRS44_012672 [Fusarium solani]
MHTLFPSVQRRHNHPNPTLVVSGESHRLYHHARSPSRPNLEAPNLPSSVLSPQAHDRSPPSVLPVPTSASPPGSRSLREDHFPTPSQLLHLLSRPRPAANPPQSSP